MKELLRNQKGLNMLHTLAETMKATFDEPKKFIYCEARDCKRFAERVITSDKEREFRVCPEHLVDFLCRGDRVTEL